MNRKNVQTSSNRNTYKSVQKYEVAPEDRHPSFGAREQYAGHWRSRGFGHGRSRLQ